MEIQASNNFSKSFKRLSNHKYDISNEKENYQKLINFTSNIRENIIEKNKSIYMLPGLYKDEEIFNLENNLNESLSYFIHVI